MLNRINGVSVIGDHGFRILADELADETVAVLVDDHARPKGSGRCDLPQKRLDTSRRCVLTRTRRTGSLSVPEALLARLRRPCAPVLHAISFVQSASSSFWANAAVAHCVAAIRCELGWATAHGRLHPRPAAPDP